MRKWWQVNSDFIAKQLELPKHLRPLKTIPHYLSQLAIVPPEFFPLVREGKIQCHRTTIKRFLPNQVELSDGTIMDADIVIFGTGNIFTIETQLLTLPKGYQIDLPFLDEKLKNTILSEDGSFLLYKTIIPIGVNNFGFVGMQCSLANQLTSEIAAHWLSQHFQGKIRLPSEENMLQSAKAFVAWQKEILKRDRAMMKPYIIVQTVHFVDELLRDMDIPVTRCNNFLIENFGPIWPSRYKNVKEQLKMKENGVSASNFYFSFNMFLLLIVAIIIAKFT